MSIYASIPGIGHEDGPDLGAPWLYLGSHHLPMDSDPREGSIGLAMIPGHITRDGRDDAPDNGRPWPWLRLHVVTRGDPCLLLDPPQARHLAGRLDDWADSACPSTELAHEAASGAGGSAESRIARVTQWAAGNPVTDRTPFGDGYRAALRDVLAMLNRPAAPAAQRTDAP